MKNYLDSLSKEEIGKISPSVIAKKINLNEGTAGVYLHEYRVLKNIKRSTTKKLVFNHLAKLSEEDITDITYQKLAESLKINENTASSYLAEYRKNLSEKTHPSSKSYLELVFRFMDENPDKRTAIDIVKKFPFIKFQLISGYVYKWHRLHPEIQMKKRARGISLIIDWTEEELENLRELQYKIYYRIMRKLGKIPKSKKAETSINYLERIKEELPYQEKKVYTHQKAFVDSCINAFNLLEKIKEKHPEVNLELTKEVIIKLRRDITNLGKDRPTTTIMGTALYLANKEITQEQSSEIMEEFGKCTRESIIHLSNLLQVKKNVMEDIQISIKLLQVICKKVPTIDYDKTEELIKEIKKRLKNKNVDRSKEIVVGTAIYLAHNELTQAQTNEIIRSFIKCRPINFSTTTNFLQLSK